LIIELAKKNAPFNEYKEEVIADALVSFYICQYAKKFCLPLFPKLTFLSHFFLFCGYFFPIHFTVTVIALSNGNCRWLV
jgi:hypothetical protein